MTPKQRDFAINYVHTDNAEKSALAAGYSERYSRSNAQRLLVIPDVVAEIKRLRTKVNQMVEKNATDVVNQFSKIAFTDRVSFMKEDPERPGEYMYKAPHELTQDQRDCVETTKMYTAEIIVIEDSKSKSIF
jgi:phage terminase small subunit